jgi:chaperone BCS1
MGLQMFSALAALSPNSTNGDSALTSLLLDSFVPGYGFVPQIVYQLFGNKAGFLVTACLICSGSCLALRNLYNSGKSAFHNYFTSTVQIRDSDDLFTATMAWTSKNMGKKCRSLKAMTPLQRGDGEENADEDSWDESEIFDYDKWKNSIPNKYEPHLMQNLSFQFNGRTFMFAKGREKSPIESPKVARFDEYINVTCYGRNAEPIKELLNYIRTWHNTSQNNQIQICRPKFNYYEFVWDPTYSLSKPSRPMSTVSLNMEEKVKIVQDINEYLHPATAKWYADRGIPYRRGYLFHGPPGTGKSSFSFAIASIFGLPVYCISLVQKHLTEVFLATLFNRLPDRCIVLLEDIDSAGLKKRTIEPAGHDDDDDSDDNENSDDDDDIPPPKGGETQITMSGLLNVLDGIAAKEGRVLIMTTNCPKNLDDALVRPGRVDMKVQFTLCSHEQITDMFMRIHSADVARTGQKSSSESNTSSAVTNPPKARGCDGDVDFRALIKTAAVKEVVEPEKLKGMAKEFADLVPEYLFSPAQLQGFLLTRKGKPSRALAEVGTWVKPALKKKKKEEARKKKRKEEQKKKEEQERLEAEAAEKKEEQGKQKIVAPVAQVSIFDSDASEATPPNSDSDFCSNKANK